MKRERFKLGSTRYTVNVPATHAGNLIMTGSAVGLLISVGLVVIAWMGSDAMRVFLGGVAAVGALIGLALWWKHR
jgi:hypothetical protein